jgi:hypothetical protein
MDWAERRLPEDVPMNWARIEDIKADVEPFPLVPAMCIGLRELKSDGYTYRGQSENSAMEGNSNGFSIPRSPSFGTIQSFQG